MDVVTVLYLAVVLVLGLAGAAKVIRPRPAARALRTAGLAEPAARSATALVRVLGLGELAIVTAALVWGGRFPALAVTGAHLGFAGFSAVVRRRSSAGHGPADCGCFGVSGTPVTRRHVFVNLGAAVVAAVVAVGPDRWSLRGPLSEVGDVIGGGPLVVTLLVAGAAALLIALLIGRPQAPRPTNSSGTVDRSTPGSDPEALAALATLSAPPPVAGTDPRTGEATTVEDLRNVALVFLSPTCLTCREFWADLAHRRALRSLPSGTRLVLITMGPGEVEPTQVSALASDHHQVLMSSEAWTRYRVPGAPYVVRIDDNATVTHHFTAPDWATALARLNR